MLRPIRAPIYSPRIIAGQVDFTSGSAVITRGSADIASVVTNGTGDCTITFKEPFARAPVFIATPSVDTFGAGRVSVFSSSNSSFRAYMQNFAGSGFNGIFNFFAVSNDSYLDHRTDAQGVDATWLSPRLMVGRYTSAGVASSNHSDFTVVNTGTGTYRVTFRTAFGSPPLVFGAAVDSDTIVCLSNQGTSPVTAFDCNINTYSLTSGSATNKPFSLMVLGSQMQSIATGGLRRNLQAFHRKPRLLPFSFVGTAPSSINWGSEWGSLTRDATGVYTLNFSKAFSDLSGAVPMVFLGARRTGGAIYCLNPTSTNTSVVFNSRAAGGSNTDVDDGYAVILGFDDGVGY